MKKKMIDRSREIRVQIRDNTGRWITAQDPPKNIHAVTQLQEVLGKDNVRVVQTILTTYVVTEGWERTGTEEKRGEHGEAE